MSSIHRSYRLDALTLDAVNEVLARLTDDLASIRSSMVAGETSSVYAYLDGTNQSVTSVAAFFIVQLNQTLWDNLGEFDKSKNRVIVQPAGLYLIVGRVGAYLDADSNVLSAIFLNGSEIARARSQGTSGSAAGNPAVVVRKLAGKDRLELKGYVSAGTSPYVYANKGTYLIVQRLG